MASSVAPTPDSQLEDLTSRLPCSIIVEYPKGQVIYKPDQRSASIYLVIEGRVKVSQVADDGREVVIDIYHPDEYFGESAFLDGPSSSEQATALERIKVMSWTTSALEEMMMLRPRVAVAVLQILAKANSNFASRIESFIVDSIARRLARSLIRFSESLGTAEDDGSVRMAPFTHELLALYVGTHREIVTVYMNQFRRMGYLRYSRKGIVLYREALREWLRQNASSTLRSAARSSSAS